MFPPDATLCGKEPSQRESDTDGDTRLAGSLGGKVGTLVPVYRGNVSLKALFWEHGFLSSLILKALEACDLMPLDAWPRTRTGPKAVRMVSSELRGVCHCKYSGVIWG